MRNHLFKFMFLLFVILMISCSPAVNVVLMPEYKGLTYSGDLTIGIYPDFYSIDIQNESSLNDDFGDGDSQEIFVKFLHKNLPTDLVNNSKFTNAIMMEKNENDNFNFKHFKIKDDISIDLVIPEEGKTFENKFENLDFILFLQNLVTDEEYTFSYNATTNVNNSKRFLIMDFDYLIWDNHEGKVVSYGKGTAKHTVFLTMNENTWKNALKTLSQLCVKSTPFARISTY